MTGRRPQPYTPSSNRYLAPTLVTLTGRSVFRWPSAHSPRPCPYCGKIFANMNALGGHLSAHRDEIEASRKEHRAFLDEVSLSLAPPGSKSTTKHCEPNTKGGLATREVPVHRAVTKLAGYKAVNDRPPFYDFLGLGESSARGDAVVVQNGSSGKASNAFSERMLELMRPGLDLSLKL